MNFTVNTEARSPSDTAVKFEFDLLEGKILAGVRRPCLFVSGTFASFISRSDLSELSEHENVYSSKPGDYNNSDVSEISATNPL